MKTLLITLAALVSFTTSAQAEVKPVGTYLPAQCSNQLSGENIGINPLTQVCVGYRVGLPDSFAISTRRLHSAASDVYDAVGAPTSTSKGTVVVQAYTLRNAKTGAQITALVKTVGGIAGTELLSVQLDDGALTIEAQGFEHMAHTL